MDCTPGQLPRYLLKLIYYLPTHALMDSSKVDMLPVGIENAQANLGTRWIHCANVLNLAKALEAKVVFLRRKVIAVDSQHLKVRITPEVQVCKAHGKCIEPPHLQVGAVN